MLTFSDGVEIDTSGDYRILHLFDGYYVTGHGILFPMDSRQECIDFINGKEVN
jgi:hypothetical protein